jgi:hypothetical protein
MGDLSATPAEVRLNNIQGNIFGGLNKDFQTLILIRLAILTKARTGSETWPAWRGQGRG